MTGRRSRPRRRRGVAAAELAVSLVFLLAPILVGIWEVGRMLDAKQILQNAAREGGRQASTGQLTVAQIQQVVTYYLADAGVTTTHATVTVTNLTEAGVDPTVAAQFDQIQVTVTVPMSDVRVASGMLITNASTILVGQVTWRSAKDAPYGAPPQPPAQ